MINSNTSLEAYNMYLTPNQSYDDKRRLLDVPKLKRAKRVLYGFSSPLGSNPLSPLPLIPTLDGDFTSLQSAAQGSKRFKLQMKQLSTPTSLHHHNNNEDRDRFDLTVTFDNLESNIKSLIQLRDSTTKLNLVTNTEKSNGDGCTA
jgi:hypothetical protein